MNPAGCSAVVTGGGSGMGAATVRRLVGVGAKVVVVDREREPAGALADETGSLLREADVLDLPALEAIAAEANALAPLRVVVHCAGRAEVPRRLVDRSGAGYDPAWWERTVSVNLTGTFNVLRATATVMATTHPVDGDGQRGVIVTIASTAGLEGAAGTAAYGASKAGVVRLSETAARDLGIHGIRVVSVAPGPVDTPLLRAAAPEARERMLATLAFPRRAADPDEVAALVCHVVDNDYVNATCLRLDAGFTTLFTP
ncbi:MAG TPA: SDR family NAD(P)-dependent oxidoreductase [Acidimicrobiales bacterium]|nr:SDR family NAD(P)-dependent oxidoreductase [Acidimicrobiales bacterium]